MWVREFRTPKNYRMPLLQTVYCTYTGNRLKELRLPMAIPAHCNYTHLFRFVN
jgi:hypothetical protein